MGRQNEKSVIDLLRTKWIDEDIYYSSEKYGHYCPFDFENRGETIQWELKSRRNTKRAYPTTIIPVSKVEARKGRLIFVFKFTDCVSYIEYDPELFSKFNRSQITTVRSGIYDAPKDHYHIPVDYLTDL